MFICFLLVRYGVAVGPAALSGTAAGCCVAPSLRQCTSTSAVSPRAPPSDEKQFEMLPESTPLMLLFLTLVFFFFLFFLFSPTLSLPTPPELLSPPDSPESDVRRQKREERGDGDKPGDWESAACVCVSRCLSGLLGVTVCGVAALSFWPVCVSCCVVCVSCCVVCVSCCVVCAAGCCAEVVCCSEGVCW